MAVVGTAFLLPVGRALARIHVKSRGDGAEAAEDGAPVEGCTSCPPVGRKPALGPKKQSAIRLEIASSHDSLLEETGFKPSVPLGETRIGPLVRIACAGGFAKAGERAEPEVRIHLSPSKRWYGAGDEEMAPSSL